jgi:osmotically-inducible protein OsmY
MVQLSGTAKNSAEKRKAAELRKSVEGVVSVDNRIRVAPKKQT